MAETQTPTKDAKANRAEALKAWHEAKTREEKAAAVAKYPVLKEIFSDLNHA